MDWLPTLPRPSGEVTHRQTGGGLAASLRGGISWGLSGAPYYATDVGGFYGDQRNAELFVRWLQAAVFSAHIRLHGIGQREPWSYANSNNDGDEAVNAANKALQLRYRLIPYIYQAIQKSLRNWPAGATRHGAHISRRPSRLGF